MKKMLQKFIADSGYCSRRKAESLIIDGKVKVNKEIAEIGARVSDQDNIVIKGKTIKPQKKPIYIILNKPKGYLCTNAETPRERNIFNLIDLKERLFVVGRLDKNSQGLVLLTNDGDWAYKLTHPSFEHEKEYIVELSQEIGNKVADAFKEGVDIGEKTKAKIKKIERIGRKRYRLILTEGRNRQIKRMFEVFNRTVVDLKRVRIDKYKLGGLKKGQWSFVEKI